MPILTKSGRIVIAESVGSRALHLAWGTGDGAWISPPSEDINATTLMNEVGRRTASEIAFVVPDVDGDIALPTGKFSRSVTPTSNLYVRTSFEFAEASSDVIREIGIFSNSEMVSGLPPGQQYFTPAEIASPGRLLHLEHLAPIFRSPAIRESFEVVITF